MPKNADPQGFGNYNYVEQLVEAREKLKENSELLLRFGRRISSKLRVLHSKMERGKELNFREIGEVITILEDVALIITNMPSINNVTSALIRYIVQRIKELRRRLEEVDRFIRERRGLVRGIHKEVREIVTYVLFSEVHDVAMLTFTFIMSLAKDLMIAERTVMSMLEEVYSSIEEPRKEPVKETAGSRTYM